MNLFVLFGDGAITRKKMTETLYHGLRALMQFSVIFFPGDTPLPNKKKKNEFIPLCLQD
jgi:hypothetical protein